jgi:hypothetical protein
MTNRIIAIYDGETDTFVEREATDIEQAEIDASEAKAAANKLEQEEKEAAELELKKSALDTLGLTIEQGIALGMYPAPKIDKALGLGGN